MIKRILLLVTIGLGVVFTILMVSNHMSAYQALTTLTFASAEEIKASIASLITIIPDLIIAIATIFAVVGCLLSLGNSSKMNKKAIKYARKIGSYYAICLIITQVGGLINAIGTSTFADDVRALFLVPEFYIPIGMVIVAAIVLTIACVLIRTPLVPGILAAVGFGILIVANITYFRPTVGDGLTNTLFYVCLGTCGLVIVPTFIPTLVANANS